MSRLLLIFALAQAGVVMAPEPPLLMLVLPMAALYCYWRPDRRKRVGLDEEASEISRSSAQRAVDYPRIPGGLKQ